MFKLVSVITYSALLVRGAAAGSVFAHFMAQNSYSYSQANWLNDINTASNTGIDGFALNLAGLDWEPDRISKAYAAAESRSGAAFSFFYSFDMGYTWDVPKMTNQITAHASSSRTYRWQNKVLVSTFGGSDRGDAFWNQLKASCANAGVPIVFAPAFTDYRDPAGASGLISKFSSIDGFFNWWAWPQDNGQLLTTASDLAFKSAIKNSRTGPYIMCEFLYTQCFPQIDSYRLASCLSVAIQRTGWDPKLGGTQNWVQLSDTLFDYRWKQAINDVKPDIVEIVTWNDYAESHYIGDINPNVYLDSAASQYWYRNGVAPFVGADQVVFWYRSHPKGVSCAQGEKPRNSQYPADAVFAQAFLTSPATVTLDIGSKHFQWNAPAGTSTGSVPFPPEDGQIPYIQIIRNGVKIRDGYGAVKVTNDCSIYNFNPFVGVIG